MMTLTIVADDTPHPRQPGLSSRHGFSLHAKTQNLNILYDFGAAGSLAANAKALNIALEDVDTAVLSHGHYDHAGGIPDFLAANSRATIYCGPGAFEPRWSIDSGTPREIGAGFSPSEETLRRFSVLHALEKKDSFVLLPAAPGHYTRPAGNARMLSGPDGSRLHDDFTDEVSLVLQGRSGLVLVSGCSHRGILNIAEQVKTYCPDCPLSALIGGLHLIDEEESDETLEATARQLKELCPEARIFTGHCTGQKAFDALRSVFGSRLEGLHVGKVLDIP